MECQSMKHTGQGLPPSVLELLRESVHAILNHSDRFGRVLPARLGLYRRNGLTRRAPLSAPSTRARSRRQNWRPGQTSDWRTTLVRKNFASDHPAASNVGGLVCKHRTCHSSRFFHSCNWPKLGAAVGNCSGCHSSSTTASDNASAS